MPGHDGGVHVSAAAFHFIRLLTRSMIAFGVA
jgi:hypothetical protein